MYNNHESVRYIRRNWLAESVTRFKTVCPDLVGNRLSDVNARKTTGCDGVPRKLIKLAAGVLCNPFCYLLNECFVQSIFPQEVKLAQVSPVYKKGDPLLKQNYRPVSVLPLLSKLFEGKRPDVFVFPG